MFDGYHLSVFVKYSVEQLLLFAEMNASVGNEMKNTSNLIIKQDGINDNILNELDIIGAQSKELFQSIMMEIMINVITKRLTYSDDLLSLCWKIAVGKDGKDPLKST